METRDKPSLLNRLVTPPILVLGGVCAIVWFFFRVFELWLSLSKDVIVFDKGSYYMLGVGLGLLALGFVVVQEFWVGTSISQKQNVVFSRMALSGILLLFVLPHLTHFVVNKYLGDRGYSICEEASHQWLFVRDIVYIQNFIECSADLKNR